MLYQGPFPQAFYRMLHRVVHAEFRMRQAIQKVKRGHLRPRTIASIPYHWLRWQIARRRLDRIGRAADARPAMASSKGEA
jgi:hypothetical protein